MPQTRQAVCALEVQLTLSLEHSSLKIGLLPQVTLFNVCFSILSQQGHNFCMFSIVITTL